MRYRIQVSEPLEPTLRSMRVPLPDELIDMKLVPKGAGMGYDTKVADFVHIAGKFYPIEEFRELKK